MTDQELRKLKRVELLELLVEQAAEMEALKEELETAKQALQTRRIILQECGSIAEASMRLSDVFAAADEAARSYVESVKALCERQEKIAAAAEGEARQRAEEMLKKTQEKCEALLRDAQKRAVAEGKT